MIVILDFVALKDDDALSHSIDQVEVLAELRAESLVERDDVGDENSDRQDHDRGDEGDYRVPQNVLR